MKCLTQTLVAGAMMLIGATSAVAQGKTIVLLPGAGGAVPMDFLMRNKSRIAAAGGHIVVAETVSVAVSAAQGASAKGDKVIFVGMSRGAAYAASAIAKGAKVNGVVFVSANYAEIESRLGSAAKLPTALVVHNRHDKCRYTPPSAAGQFARWSGGKVDVQMLNIGGAPVPNPCGPRGGHGFFMKDGAAVSAIIGFIRSH